MASGVGDRAFNHFNFNQLSTLGLRLYSLGNYSHNNRRGLGTVLIVSSTVTVLALVIISSSIPSHLSLPFTTLPFPSIFRFPSRGHITTSSTTTAAATPSGSGSSSISEHTEEREHRESNPNHRRMFSITAYIASALASFPFIPWNSASSTSTSSNGISNSNSNGVKRITGPVDENGDEERRIEGILELGERALAPGFVNQVRRETEELKLVAELEEVRREMEEMRKECEVLKEVNGILDRESGELKGNIARLMSEYEELRRENEEVKKEREMLRSENGSMHVEVDKMRKDMEEGNDILRKEYDQHVKMNNVQLNDAKKESEEVQERLVRVEAEKKGIETKLKTYLERDQDQVEQEEVVRLVEALNHDIDQVAGTISCSFQGRKLPQALDGNEMNEVISSLTEILGGHMVEMLVNGVGQEVEETVKMALQASMAAYVEWIVSSWCFENPEDEKFWNDIYGRVRQSEESVVAGRWRSLTRKHLQQMKFSSSTATENDLKIYMFDAFVNILLVVGYADDAQRLLDELVEQFGDSVGAVLSRAQGLNRVVGERIVKSDVEVVYIVPDEEYVASRMNIERGEGSRVLCTTGLGLSCTMYGIVMKAVVVLG